MALPLITRQLPQLAYQSAGAIETLGYECDFTLRELRSRKRTEPANLKRDRAPRVWRNLAKSLTVRPEKGRQESRHVNWNCRSLTGSEDPERSIFPVSFKPLVNPKASSQEG